MEVMAGNGVWIMMTYRLDLAEPMSNTYINNHLDNPLIERQIELQERFEAWVVKSTPDT